MYADYQIWSHLRQAVTQCVLISTVSMFIRVRSSLSMNTQYCTIHSNITRLCLMFYVNKKLIGNLSFKTNKLVLKAYNLSRATLSHYAPVFQK